MAKIPPPKPFDFHHPDWPQFTAAVKEILPINSSEKAAQYREIYKKFTGVSLEVPVV